MKISVLIIAHNEEAHIEECLVSVMRQSRKPDEIILVAHNCADQTVVKAKNFEEVQILELKTEETGPTTARKHGFENVTGDIIACLDGDSYVDSLWLESIAQSFTDPDVVGVGGKVYFHNNWKGNVVSFFFFLTGYFPANLIFSFYFWGASFAVKKDAYKQCGGIGECETIAKELHLHYCAEDCILSFLLHRYGKLVFVSGAKSWVYPGKFFDGENRGKKQIQDHQTIRKYFTQLRK